MATAKEKIDTEDLEALNAQLADYMARKGLRSTSQRRVVTDTFFRAHGRHLSIEDLLAMVRKRDPKVGYATIYRTLKLLAECGLANERHFGDGVTRYEIAHEEEHHDHLICTSCNCIIEFEDDRIEKLQEQVAKRHGFVVSSHKHELYGLCSTCVGERS